MNNSIFQIKISIKSWWTERSKLKIDYQDQKLK
jgi:hypothetical protein